MPGSTEHSPSPTPARAVSGFVAYLLSRAAFLLYLAWALLPDDALRSLGLADFLPQRYWAVAVPIYAATVFAALVLVGYPSLGLCLTPTLDDVRNVTDERAIYSESTGAAENHQVGDVSLSEQLETIYSKGRSR